MALQKTKYSEIPADAIILSENEALEYQIETIRNWRKSRDTWSLKHGYAILSTMSGLTALYLNNHYRTRLRLRELGRLSSYLPVVVIPSLVTGIFHQQFIVSDIVLQKSCPVCLQVRAAAFQTTLGAIFPFILAPLAALPVAIRYMTYKVPSITKEPMQVLAMMKKHTKPISNIFLGIIAAQALAAMLLTSKEIKSFIHIQEKLNEIEKTVDEIHSTDQYNVT